MTAVVYTRGVRRARLQQSCGGSGSSARGSRATRRSPRPRARALAPKLDLRYGPGPQETLDLFLPRDARARHVRVHARRLLARARQVRFLVRRAGRSSRRASRSPSSTTICVPTCRSRRSSTNAARARRVGRARRRRARRERGPHRRRRTLRRRPPGGDDVRDRLGTTADSRAIRSRAASRCPASTISLRCCSSRSTRTSSSMPRRRAGCRRSTSCQRARGAAACSRSAPTRPRSSCGSPATALGRLARQCRPAGAAAPLFIPGTPPFQRRARLRRSGSDLTPGRHSRCSDVARRAGRNGRQTASPFPVDN